MCEHFGSEIFVVQNETTSPEKEMIDDIISIIHVFSSRIYGLRRYKKAIREDRSLLEDPNEEQETDISI